ncbi:hypothetical protein D9M68_882150 [compost metagenome]
MPVQNQVPQFMGGVESAGFSRFLRVQKYERRYASTPARERVDLARFFGQGKNTYTFRLKKVNHVLYRQ